METYKLRILHISDLHAGDPRERAWRRQRVLGDAWKRNLDELLEDGAFDLVCFTGDVAHGGKAKEYVQAGTFLRELLGHLELSVERLFVVPGNHDVDRDLGKAAWQVLRENYYRDELASWMAGGKPPPGFKDGQREEVLSRQAAYWSWVEKGLGRPDLLPKNSPHSLLGYRHSFRLPGHSFDTHIIGLDSAWAAGDNNDAGKLLLTDEQVGMLTTGPDGKALIGFRLALIHHPLSDLFDGAHARGLLADNVDLLLRGHLHEESVETLVDPSRTSRQLAAGCIYGSDRWPNACHALEAHLDKKGRPSEYKLRFRAWAPKNGHWFDDGGVYREARNGRLTWRLTTAPLPPPSPAPPPVFVGREDELRQLANAILTAGGDSRRPVSIQGMAGIGKTTLVEQFFTRHKAHFPGGLLRLLIDPQAPQAVEALLGQLADQLKLPVGGHELADVLQARLQRSLPLLLVENVDSEEAGAVAAELAQRLPLCPLIFTGRFQGLGASAGWRLVEMPLLEETQALEQLKREWRPPRPEEETERRILVKELGLLPLALHLAAGYLRTGAYDATSFLAELRAQQMRLQHVDPAARRDARRSVLASTFELSLELLRGQLGADAERMLSGLAALGQASASGFGISLGSALANLTAGDFRRLLHHAIRLSIVSPVPPAERPDEAWRIHPLIAEFLRNRPGGAEGFSRMTEWFVARLPVLDYGQEEEQGARWKDIHQETAALVDWLARLPEKEFMRVERIGSRYAFRSGPYAAWMSFCERGLKSPLQVDARSHMLWTLAQVAYRGGALDRAFAAAQEKGQIDQERGSEHDVALVAGLRADILQARGQLDEALRMLREESLPIFDKLGDVRSRAITLGKIADILQARGQLDEALHLHREEELPIYYKLGDIRERAITLGKIADILQTRGRLDEALRIRREEELPVYDKLGEAHSRAVTLGQIADLLKAQGQFDEALRIRRKEELPVYEKLGDVRSHTITLGKIANILQARGQLDEALRVCREEVLPVFDKLGDVHLRAIIMGQIADIFQARGQLDEALRIRREEELPVYEKLGDVRSRAITLGLIADIFRTQGQLDEALRIRREEELPVFDKLGDVHSRAIALVRIADILQARGQLDEALHICREEVLPVFDKLGDVHSCAITLGQIANVLQAQGQLGEALRILREEALPVYEKLGDVRYRAITLGKVADILQARGELDEALRILREEALPVFEKLGDVHSLLVGRANLALIYLQRNQPGDRDEAAGLLRLALSAAEQLRIPEAERIRQTQRKYGLE